ncbi:MAG: hypothetical protein KAQ87_04530 [Candidatus Pacebacteria bacterium]|nr:hypothetical protein [Candidatus Paceibacterota bacterium]
MNSEKTIVVFNKIREIGEVEMLVAEYIRDNSEKVFFIPAKDDPIPPRDEPCLVVLPSSYYNRKTVYSVKTIRPEKVGETTVFRDVFISDYSFQNINSKVAIIIMNPKEELETLLLRIAVNNGNKEAVKRFLAKNILLEHTEVRIKRNKKEEEIIEIIIEPLEDFDYLRNGLLKHLSNQLV